jgi:hypothetical protein
MEKDASNSKQNKKKSEGQAIETGKGKQDKSMRVWDVS